MSLSARHRQAAAHASIRERQPHRARAPGRRAPVLGDAGAHVEDVAAGPGLELVGRPVGDEPAAVDDRDAVGEMVGLVESHNGFSSGRQESFAAGAAGVEPVLRRRRR